MRSGLPVEGGYTLVEVLTGLFITSMVLVLLVTSLQFGGR